MCSGIAEVRLVLQAHQTAAAELIEQSGLIFAAVDPLLDEVLEGLGDQLACGSGLGSLLGSLGGQLELLVGRRLLERLDGLGGSLGELLDKIGGSRLMRLKNEPHLGYSTTH